MTLFQYGLELGCLLAELGKRDTLTLAECAYAELQYGLGTSPADCVILILEERMRIIDLAKAELSRWIAFGNGNGPMPDMSKPIGKG